MDEFAREDRLAFTAKSTEPMKRASQLLLFLLLVTGIGQSAVAADDPASEEPEITITRNKSEIIEEYRINGQLYMIKITPKKGFSYFLVDTDGDGALDRRQNELDEGLLIPQWTLFRW